MFDMDTQSPPETVLTLADRMKWARDRKGWSQPHLAVVAEVSTSTVGMIESGARQNKGSLPQLAMALGVRHRWLLHGELPVTEPMPKAYAPFASTDKPEGVTAVPKGTAPIAYPPLSPEAEQKLTRFLRALRSVPHAQQAAAIAAATEALLDHLP